MISISRVVVIPHIDGQWTIMQMKHFEIWVTVTQEEWQTIEQCEVQLEEAVDRQVSSVSWKIPVLELWARRLNFMGEELRKLCSKEVFDEIIKRVKLIK